MNLLLFTLEYPPFKGGIANYYGNLINFWPEPNNIFVLHNYENKLIKNIVWPKWLPALYNLYSTIKIKKIGHILIGHILPLGTATYYISKLTRTPYSVFLHGTDLSFALRTPRKKKMAYKILNKAENIICTNSYVKKLAADFSGNDEKIYVVNPGISNIECRMSSAVKPPLANGVGEINLNIPPGASEDSGILNDFQDKIILFSLGRLVRRKGFDKVIAVLPEVLKAVPNLIYVIAGSGPDEYYLKTLAKSLFNHVIFVGSVNEAEKWTWFNKCDIFITVSREIDGDYEGFGIVYLEAGLAGKPVIAGDSGGTRDAVIHNLNGILVNSENNNEIAWSIINLCEDKNLRQTLGEQGKKRVLNEFNCKNKIEKIYKIINK